MEPTGEELQIYLELTESPDFSLIAGIIENLSGEAKYLRLIQALEALKSSIEAVNKNKRATKEEKLIIYQALEPVSKAMQTLKNVLEPTIRQTISEYLARVYKFWRTISEKPVVPHIS